MRKEYLKRILEENFGGHEENMTFTEWIELEFENAPESFDNFFESSWNEISEEEKEERMEIILSIR
jgi:hypothetical protein